MNTIVIEHVALNVNCPPHGVRSYQPRLTCASQSVLTKSRSRIPNRQARQRQPTIRYLACGKIGKTLRISRYTHVNCVRLVRNARIEASNYCFTGSHTP